MYIFIWFIKKFGLRNRARGLVLGCPWPSLPPRATQPEGRRVMDNPDNHGLWVYSPGPKASFADGQQEKSMDYTCISFGEECIIIHSTHLNNPANVIWKRKWLDPSIVFGRIHTGPLQIMIFVLLSFRKWNEILLMDVVVILYFNRWEIPSVCLYFCK